MPWLEPDRSGSFHIAFRFLGRRYRRSLRTSDRREAERLAARVEDNLRLIERGRIVVPDDEDLGSFLLSDCRVAGPAPKRSTVETLTQLFDAYFDRMGSDKLEWSTLQGMKTHRRHLERLLGKRRSLATIKIRTLQEYIKERSKEKARGKERISPATVKKELVTLRTVWNALWKWELVAKPYPGKELIYSKTDAKLPFRTLAEVEERLLRGNVTAEYAAQLWKAVFLSVDELAQLLSHVKAKAREPYAYLLFVFAAHTGARRSEVLRSEIDDFDFRSGTVLVHERKRVHTSRSTRSVAMSRLLEETAREWLRIHPGGQYTFPDLVEINPKRKPAKKAGEDDHEKDSLPPILLNVDRTHDIFRRTLADTPSHRHGGEASIPGLVLIPKQTA